MVRGAKVKMIPRLFATIWGSPPLGDEGAALMSCFLGVRGFFFLSHGSKTSNNFSCDDIGMHNQTLVCMYMHVYVYVYVHVYVYVYN